MYLAEYLEAAENVETSSGQEEVYNSWWRALDRSTCRVMSVPIPRVHKKTRNQKNMSSDERIDS
jgi:hypothetical protein